MLLEQLYERLVHLHRIPKSMTEEDGSLIASRLRELLEVNGGEQKDETLPVATDKAAIKPRH